MAQLSSLKWRMRKVLPHLVWLSGLILFVFGLQYVPEIILNELPKVTPEMRSYFHRQCLLSEVGLFIFLTGIAWVAVRWAIRHFSERTQ